MEVLLVVLVYYLWKPLAFALIAYLAWKVMKFVAQVGSEAVLEWREDVASCRSDGHAASEVAQNATTQPVRRRAYPVCELPTTKVIERSPKNLVEGFQFTLESMVSGAGKSETLRIINGLLSAGVLVESHPLQEEMRCLARELQKPLNERFALYLLPSLDPNAFSMPGGVILINVGTLFLAQSRDELAFVLGHEMTHWIRRHHVVGMYSQMTAELCNSIARSIGYRNQSFLWFEWQEERGPLQMFLADIVSAVGQRQLAVSSQSDEYEADRGGVALAQRAGYSPEGAVSFFNKLDQLQEATVGRQAGQDVMSLYFSSHPANASRRAALCGMITDLDSRITLRPDAWYRERVGTYLEPSRFGSSSEIRPRSAVVPEGPERTPPRGVLGLTIGSVIGMAMGWHVGNLFSGFGHAQDWPLTISLMMAAAFLSCCFPSITASLFLWGMCLPAGHIVAALPPIRWLKAPLVALFVFVPAIAVLDQESRSSFLTLSIVLAAGYFLVWLFIWMVIP